MMPNYTYTPNQWQPTWPNQAYPAANVPMQTTAQVSPQRAMDADWVQGEVGARAYAVGPSHMAWLMDAEDNVFYLKSVDQFGMPQPLRKFRFIEEPMDKKALSSGDSSPMMTKEEIERIVTAKVEEMMK